MVHVVVTLERGMYRARSKARTTRVTSTTKTVNAAFSKSAIRGIYSNAIIQN